MNPIKPIKIEKDMKVSDLVSNLKNCGFNAKRLGEATDILKKVIQDEECKLFVSFAGALVPAGMKQIFIDMIDKKMIDVLVTTGANLTHDLIEALGFEHYHYDGKEDDSELRKKGFDRIYNVLMKNEVYEKLEKWFEEHFDELNSQSNTEFLLKIGKLVENTNSILATCYKNNIPLFCPALSDSGIGLMIWSMMTRKKKPLMQEYNDLPKIIDIAWKHKKKAVFYIGGGTPKNYTQQAMQFSSPAQFGVQIKIDDESFGGSSGAPLKEGISWGKIDEKAQFIDVTCDATIALPLIYSGLL
ncbi:MAG: deoxyhypusine synthase [archaeon]|nr:MAG: deoxyhypusine synthase [archaeon]